MTENKQPRVYTLDDRGLTQEQMAVIFAMTSRSPEPFDRIAETVSREKAADFHQRWVLDYGHASVAEHAVVHLAIESISRIAGDAIEQNRLASYTEKSSRYQVIERGDYHTPREINSEEALGHYHSTHTVLFDAYEQLLKQTTRWLSGEYPMEDRESSNAYNLRLRRMATDACRNVLPASILTNVGMTANARTLEHLISKLMSSDLEETAAIGESIREQARLTIPTLVKYADYSHYLADNQMGTASHILPHDAEYQTPPAAALVEYQDDPTLELATALLYRNSAGSYPELRHHVSSMTRQQRASIISEACLDHGPHDELPREFETVEYTFEFTMDYGALREFNRHRMMTPLHKPLTTNLGTRTPTLIRDSKLTGTFEQATESAGKLHELLENEHGHMVAQYAVTHAHLQPVAARMNLRQLAHIIALRTSPRAHAAISEPVRLAAEAAAQAHPELFEAIAHTNPNR